MAVVGFGLATTLLWLVSTEEAFSFASRNLGLLFLALIEIAILTTFNLAIRWLRWHFLLRRFKIRVRTKESLAIWSATIPAIATPFYFGELVRGIFLTRRYPRSFRAIAGIWLVERFADFLILGLFLFLILRRLLIVIGIIGVTTLAIILLRKVTRSYTIGIITRPLELGVVILSTAFAWIFPILGLWIVLTQLGVQITSINVAEAFSVGTLLGGITGIPLGIGVTGSLMILSLQSKGIPLEIAAIVIAAFRAGTVWYAIGFGLTALVLWRTYIARLIGSQRQHSHFDLIAQGYKENIPQYMVERLLARKADVMQNWLEQEGKLKSGIGLDIGCGHGWYLSEMARRGHSMAGCDSSFRQVQQATSFLSKQNVLADLCVADVESLPYADNSFHFAFSVNVIHHITRDESRQNTFSEILRVLKPGGIFFLQEINIENPLFRFYMGYIFPLLRDIDEGIERWIPPKALPNIEGGKWVKEISYFNFLPDFLPHYLLKALAGFEKYLERSQLRTWSSHYVACFIKR